MQEFLPLKLPFVPGWDLSGVVEAVGAGVSKFKVGDEVYAALALAPNRNGSYAEYTITTEEETAAKPRTLDHVHAATIGVAGLTAWRSLFETAQLAAGQKVLIHRRGRRCGHLCRPVRSLEGRSRPWHRIDGKPGVPRATRGRRAHRLHQDSLRGSRCERRRCAGQHGRRGPGAFVESAAQGRHSRLPGRPASCGSSGPARSSLHYARNSPSAAAMAEIAKVIDSGHCKVFVDTVLPLAEARRAQEIERGRPHPR